MKRKLAKMMRIRNVWRHRRSGEWFLPLRYKILISYMFLVLVPVILIGSYAYKSSQQAISENTRANLEIAVRQLGSNVNYRVDDLMRVAEVLFADQTLSGYLSGYFMDYEKYAVTTQYILPRLESAVNMPNMNMQISMYLDNSRISEFYYNYSLTETKKTTAAGRQYSIFHTDRIRGEEWYRSLQLNVDTKLWKQVGDDEAQYQISYLRPLINYDTLDTIGFIKITVKLTDIFSDMDLTKLGKDSRLLVTDSGNRLLYTGSRIMEQSDATLSMENGEQYLQIRQPIPSMPASIEAWIPYASFQDNARQVRNLTILVCVLSLVVLTIISVIMSRYLLRRFYKLIDSLRAFQEGNFHKRMPSLGKDEFGRIGMAFNEMAATIEKLIDEVYVGKLEKKEVELQVLHAQMNPHFLYNTFSSISRMAKLGEINKLDEMIRSLAMFYRLSLNKGEMLIPIGKELQIIQSYLDIQRIKFADRIIANFEVDETLSEYTTIKFILQPFVENVLEHAWYDDRIVITVRVYSEGDVIWMEVEDNGLGMRQEMIDSVLDPSGQGLGYGIWNVDARIKLHFGKQYGVSIISDLGEGTLVRISFPPETV
ncbi:cache domain-containing sensor histidine kinase [Paenibacillus puerhi]|uniref:cache domain-containing sensor histidine kinase n=1 Tax=Paenibacillus puerhi TaxID=2692622 RepID=UPI001F3661A1|nr:histidine kinase [Paenibacillus puerhi]